MAERAAGTRPSQTGLEDELLEIFRTFGLTTEDIRLRPAGIAEEVERLRLEALAA